MRLRWGFVSLVGQSPWGLKKQNHLQASPFGPRINNCPTIREVWDFFFIKKVASFPLLYSNARYYRYLEPEVRRIIFICKLASLFYFFSALLRNLLLTVEKVY